MSGGVAVIGTGSAVPEKILTNFDLEKMVDTTDDWIRSRTGILERRIAAPAVAASDLAVQASQRAIEAAGVSAETLDLIVVATVTSDMVFPSTACLVQKALGATNAACFDVNAACTGYLYAMAAAKAMIETGSYQTALIIGTEVLSRITNWGDRSTCVLFGDGAGAAVLKKTTTASGPRILSVTIGSDGKHSDILKVAAGGSRQPTNTEVLEQKSNTISMEGGEVFKLAVTKMIEAAQTALDACGKTLKDVSLFIPHQANSRIIEAVAKRLRIPIEKVFMNIHKYGNMSAATTAVAMDEAVRDGRLKKGDLVELVAFGAGLTWGAAVIEW